MLIKRVVIQGFKTFAKRTEFVFDPGITAVVGPNGSGKSNIVDAVRWCLGEQSFSLLRSKKTSDIIFAGSDKRARLGMAQVSLMLDNSGGEIPIDFAEVEITRRAYRDGDNEYLVNGQRVRLQDVSELLSQTGLGKRTYAVIGQGLIDRVLSLAPEERRSLFEEAAGISGYQAKRETAVRRLDATQQNLTRVRDITAELYPRLGYMKRQSDRAREREQMVHDLRGLLREWYGFKWHAAIAEVEVAHADALILRNSMDDRQALIEAAAADLETIRILQAEVRSTLGDYHRSGSDLHRDAEAVGRELAVSRERLHQVQDRAEELLGEIGPLRVQRDALGERLQASHAAVERARMEAADRRAELAVTEAALAERRREQDRLQAAIDAARRTLFAIQQRETESSSRSTQLRERLTGLDATRQKTLAALTAAEAEALRLAGEVASAEASLAEIESSAADLNRRALEAEQRRAAARSELDAAEVARRSADRETDQLQTRLDLLRRLSHEGAGLSSGVRHVVQAGLPGIIGTVASLLRVAPEHDRAIETAIGGSLQNIVTQDWDSAQNAIDHLKQNRRGRATFLPLGRLYTSSKVPAPRMAGVLGNAADLVDSDPRTVEVRDHLLNRIWVVDNLVTARRALDNVRDGSRPTVVTLDGDIVRPGGAVTGGSESDRRDDASILARERELRELPALVEHALAHAAGAAIECRRLATDVETESSEIERLQLQLADLARREKSRRNLLEEQRRTADRAQQQARHLADQAAQSESDQSSLSEQESRLRTTLSELATQRRSAEEALAQAEVDAATGSADELLRLLADQRAAEAAAVGFLNSRSALAEQQARSLEELAGQVIAKERRTAELDAEAATLAQTVQALIARETAIRARLDALQSLIAPEEARLAALDARFALADSRERTLQHDQRRDESAWAHAQVTLQRAEDVVQHLRADIQRDLGLVTLEQSDDVAYQPPLPWDAFVEQLPVRDDVPDGLAEELAALRTRVARLSSVNPDAPREYDDAVARYEYLTTQADDLEAAAADLNKIIRELDGVMQQEFTRTFKAVAEQFKLEFRKLFNGGTAELVLTEPESVATSGIDIIARPPGKRPQSLALLSGGERSLAACALIFAILRVSPTPFCVLDEVDAALDEANVDRFRLAVEELSDAMQFIIVTHNRRTLEGSNTIYGVTMSDDGVSKVISLRLEGDHIVHHNAPLNGAPVEEEPPTPDEIAVFEETVHM